MIVEPMDIAVLAAALASNERFLKDMGLVAADEDDEEEGQ